MSPADFDPEDPAFRERLTAYLDGELSPEESRKVLVWLEKNPKALKELEEHRRVWALLGKYRDEPVPVGFAERVLSTAGAAPASSSSGSASAPGLRVLRGGRALRFAAVAATVVLAIGVGTFAMRREAEKPAGTASPFDAVPLALLESEAVVNLATVSDEEFETILQGDPEDLVQVVAGRGGGG
jgi:anti-sigma factor RsiW